MDGDGEHSFDFGNFLALVVIFGLVFVGICACLGKYARVCSGRI